MSKQIRKLAGVTAMVLAVVACGSGTGSSAQQQTSPIKLGYLLELSGPFAPNGKNIQNGWNLAVQDLGDTVNGRKVETIFSDEQGDPNIAISQARQLIEQQQVDIIEGPTSAATSAATSSYTGPSGVPEDDISMCSVEQYKAYQKYSQMFASSWSCDQPSLIAGKYARDTLGYKHVTTVGLDYAFGWTAIGGFTQGAGPAGEIG